MRVALLLVTGLLLAGCVIAPPRPVAAPITWDARRSQLQAVTQFRLEGRLAAAVGQEGFSASLIWVQRGSRSELDLRAPLGFGSALVTRDGADIRLKSSRGQNLSGGKATEELARRLGFEPPLDSLRYWVLGVPDPAHPEIETPGEDASLASLEQEGWRVEYAEYRVSSSGALLFPMPRRLTLTRSGVRLRLVIDKWTLITP